MIYPKVAVVILNWNGQKHLAEFLPSVCKSSYPNLEIIIGDNASTDNSISFLKKNYPSIRIIFNEKNLGFAEGYNEILSHVESDYFVLLNSDVEVTPNWIEPVIELMQSDDKIAATQPKILSYTNKDTFEYAGAAGGFIDRFAFPFCRGRIFDSVELDMGQYDNDLEVFWASGCAFFIKVSAWKRVNGLDGRFFAHMEEIDLCWRLKNLGYKIMCCGKSTVYHLGGGTLNAESAYKTYLNFRNNVYLIKKNIHPSRSFFLIPFRFCLDFLALLKFVKEGKYEHAKAVSKAHRHIIKAIYNKEILYNKDISIPNSIGKYNKNIVWQYFVLGKKKFQDLNNQ